MNESLGSISLLHWGAFARVRVPEGDLGRSPAIAP